MHFKITPGKGCPFPIIRSIKFVVPIDALSLRSKFLHNTLVII
jgi:hypothetical protein